MDLKPLEVTSHSTATLHALVRAIFRYEPGLLPILLYFYTHSRMSTKPTLIAELKSIELTHIQTR